MTTEKPEREETMQDAKKWKAPVMLVDPERLMRYRSSAKDEKDNASRIPTAEDVEQWRKDAEAEGYEQGLRKADEELSNIKNRLNQLINFFEHPLKAMNEEIELQLTQVAVSLAQQLVRRELRIDPGEIVGLIRDCVQLLPGNARQISIVLHPDDANLVRNALSLDASDEEHSWKLVEDPMITRGGCEIKAMPSNINATLENRLSALAASVLGGEREED